MVIGFIKQLNILCPQILVLPSILMEFRSAPKFSRFLCWISAWERRKFHILLRHIANIRFAKRSETFLVSSLFAFPKIQNTKLFNQVYTFSGHLNVEKCPSHRNFLRFDPNVGQWDAYLPRKYFLQDGQFSTLMVQPFNFPAIPGSKKKKEERRRKRKEERGNKKELKPGNR